MLLLDGSPRCCVLIKVGFRELSPFNRYFMCRSKTLRSLGWYTKSLTVLADTRLFVPLQIRTLGGTHC